MSGDDDIETVGAFLTHNNGARQYTMRFLRI